MTMSEPKLDPDIEAMVDFCYDKVEKLYLFYKIKPDDWEYLEKESPKIMQRIREIEQTVTGTMPKETVQDYLTKWVRNWDLAFRRRFNNRG
jgi:hypothetical protein